MYHKMMPQDFFINDTTINIFTDASITQRENIWIGAPGAHAYLGDKFIVKKLKCIKDFTINESELEAIHIGVLLGLSLANSNPNTHYRINIFSDSMISIKGLTEWVYSWHRNCMNGIWYNYNREPVSNQYLYMQIIETILKFKPTLQFYHIKGHYDNCITSNGINMDKIAKLEEFKQSFSKVNRIGEDTTIDNNLARFFIIANNSIDLDTRVLVNNPQTQTCSKLKVFPRFLDNPFTDHEMNLYRQLTLFS